MSQTTSDVIEELNERFENIETEESDLVGGVLARFPEDEIGSAMGYLHRQSEYEFEAQRDPSGETLEVAISADRQTSLADLFR
jgi:hypothetical protein